VNPDRPARQVLPEMSVLRANRVFRVFKVNAGAMVYRVKWDRQVLQVRQVLPVRKAMTETQVQQVFKVFRVYKAHKANKVYKALMEMTVLQELPVHRV
jgi:hypothetical protein